jgi:hypothetical protein
MRLGLDHATFRTLRLAVVLVSGLVGFSGSLDTVGRAWAADEAPVPLLEAGQPVDYLFVFKFNTKSFPGCGADATRACPLGGSV